MSKLKVGIIGAGYIGNLHAGVLGGDDRVKIAAVHDIELERAEQLARAHGATVAQEASELIANVDAVYITTPNTRHTDLAASAIDAGKHVFCEKPMATNLAAARALLDRASASDRVFQVGHNRRFAPVYATLKRILSENEPHSAHIKMNRGELLSPGWVGNPEVTGGFLYETTIHMFDMVRFLFGEVVRLYAVGSSHEYGEVDDFSALLVFANGLHATLASAADASWLFPFERVEVFCHHATLVTREMESLTHSKSLEGHHSTQSWHQLSKEQRWGYTEEDRAFIDSILSSAPVPVTAHDGFKSVELVDACYRAVRTGSYIEF